MVPGPTTEAARSRLVSPALLQSEARLAADAVLQKSLPKSPAAERKHGGLSAATEKTPRSRPASLLQKPERRKLAPTHSSAATAHLSGGERSRLQLKPATSPKLSTEKYPMVEEEARSGRGAGSSEPAVRSSSSSQERQKAGKKEGRRSAAAAAATAAQPLVPWSVRSKEPPKNSGGWSWRGEGCVARVYLNVSFFYFFYSYCMVQCLTVHVYTVQCYDPSVFWIR